ncbi:MAG TPA: hypothetical protein VKA54_02055 [Gemmatimonadaceae bacterium]|nr:hypothetical protein [Gemmatimonadaceae bacterium]
MPTLLKPLLIALRATAVVALLLGILVWTGRPLPWRSVHMGVGLLLGVLLLALSVVVVRATGRASAVVIALVWTVLLVAYGIGHASLWPGSMHWIAQVLHLLVGLATLGIAERLAARTRRATA